MTLLIDTPTGTAPAFADLAREMRDVRDPSLGLASMLVRGGLISGTPAPYEPRPQWRAVLKRVMRYADPTIYGTRAAQPSVALSAINLLIAVFGSGPAPTADLMDDGEIEVRWERGEKYLSVALLPDGRIVAYATGPNWPKLDVDEAYTDGWNHAQLKPLLRDL